MASSSATNGNPMPGTNNENSNNHTNDKADKIEVLAQTTARVGIEKQDWDKVEATVRSYPALARQILEPQSSGRTLLHWLTAIGSTPVELIRMVAALNPAAILQPDRHYGDTPIHQCCRHSVTSASKLETLLLILSNNNHVPTTNDATTTINAKLGTRNQFGGTPLHSACNHNACLPAIRALLRHSSQIANVRTFQGHHAVTTLWQSYTSTIHGHMCVAKLLLTNQLEHNNNNDDDDAEVNDEKASSPSVIKDLPLHFQKFWAKLQCLVGCEDSSQQQYLFHRLLRCQVPFLLYRVALRLIPASDLQRPDDDNGSSVPLHWVLENRPYRLHEPAAIQELVRKISSQSDLAAWPLRLAIRNKIPWEQGTRYLANPVAVGTPTPTNDDEDGLLWPYQLAAAVGGKPALETIYQLLLLRPDLVNC